MTITEVDLIKHEGTTDETGSGFDVEYDIAFSGLYDPFAVKALSSIIHNGQPVDVEIGADIAYDAGIYLRRRRPIVLESYSTGGRFTLELTYRDGLQFVENPLMRKDRVQWRRYDEQKQIFEDIDDKKIVTTANEIYSDMPTVPVARFFATITGFRDSYRLSFDNESKFPIVNDAPITVDGIIVNAGCARYAGGEASRDRINGYDVVAHTWQLELKASHKLRLLNVGSYGMFGTGPSRKRLRIYDPNTGQPMMSPWPLDADGDPLPQGWAPNDVLWNEYETVIEADYDYFDWTF